MSSEKTKWWKTPPYSNIVGGLTVVFIVWVITLIREWYLNTPVFANLGQYGEYIWKNFISYLNSPIKLWIILVLLISYSIFIWLRRKIRANSSVHKVFDKDLQPKNRRTIDNYTVDKFFKFTWEWIWVKNVKLNISEPKNITPCCPSVQCELSPMRFKYEGLGYAEYTCDNCKSNHTIRHETFGNILDIVTLNIEQNISQSTSQQ